MPRSIAAIALPALLLLANLSAAPPATERSATRFAVLLARVDAGEAIAADEIDRAAGQKDALRSRLFWHTDLDAALAVARAEHKPVLSLRLLGRLDEELSCANSRFFRKTLYVDPAVVRILRERFVLHWQSLRPVPILTIDFGDGRPPVRRTITGNSIHYALTPDGRVIDALPGLYDAATFAAELNRIADAATNDDDAALAAYRSTTRGRLLASANTLAVVRPVPAAERSASIARSKLVLERPTLAAVRNPSDVVAADTRLNQTSIRPRLLAWLDAKPDLDALNRRVYAELFLAPLDDPNMGLNPPDEAALVPSR